MGRKPAEEQKREPGRTKKHIQKKALPPQPQKKGRPVKTPMQKKPKRTEPMTTAEWRKIRLEYVKGKTTYQKLAEKYGVGESTIRKRASNEGWRKKRNKLDTKVEQKTLARMCDARAEEFLRIAQVNDRMDEVLGNLLDFVQQQPPKKYDDLRGVESLTKAIATVVQTKRDLYNIPTEIDRAKIEALRDKQKLEREKFAEEQAEKAASKAAAENTIIRVVIENENGQENDGQEVALDE